MKDIISKNIDMRYLNNISILKKKERILKTLYKVSNRVNNVTFNRYFGFLKIGFKECNLKED